ncbi:hypothetical protein D3C78_1449300 [compost metagenome]
MIEFFGASHGARVLAQTLVIEPDWFSLAGGEPLPATFLAAIGLGPGQSGAGAVVWQKPGSAVACSSGLFGVGRGIVGKSRH